MNKQENMIKKLMKCKEVLHINDDYFLCVNEFKDNKGNELHHYHYEWVVGKFNGKQIVNNSCHYSHNYKEAKEYFDKLTTSKR